MSTPVYSLADGTVSGMYTTKKGIIILEVTYGDGDKFRFLHLNEYSSNLKVGSKVAEGQIIAYSGNSGGYPAHLHVDAKDKNGKSIDSENKNYGKMTNAEFFSGKTTTPSTFSFDFKSSFLVASIDATIVSKTYSNIIQLSSISTPQATTYTVTANALNLRTGAGKGFGTNGDALISGTNVTGTGNTNGDWSEVKAEDGRKGWINLKYTKTRK